ncbi:MAG: transcription antitermination factor NusB [Clostridia bacterium]|nr:transcription antitermination factor NusB [Clostridia bacterium]
MRRNAREKAFALMFESIFNKSVEEELDNELILELKKEDEQEFAKELVTLFKENESSINDTIKKYLINYDFERLYKIDLALLYLALTEIIYVKTPTQVVINETLEIAKLYSTDKSHKFINGILSSIVKGENL